MKIEFQDMTHEKADNILNAFNELISFVPKKRLRDNLFALNEVSIILDTIHRQTKGKS